MFSNTQPQSQFVDSQVDILTNKKRSNPFLLANGPDQTHPRLQQTPSIHAPAQLQHSQHPFPFTLPARRHASSNNAPSGSDNGSGDDDDDEYHAPLIQSKRLRNSLQVKNDNNMSSVLSSAHIQYEDLLKEEQQAKESLAGPLLLPTLQFNPHNLPEPYHMNSKSPTYTPIQLEVMRQMEIETKHKAQEEAMKKTRELGESFGLNLGTQQNNAYIPGQDQGISIDFSSVKPIHNFMPETWTNSYDNQAQTGAISQSEMAWCSQVSTMDDDKPSTSISTALVPYEPIDFAKNAAQSAQNSNRHKIVVDDRYVKSYNALSCYDQVMSIAKSSINHNAIKNSTSWNRQPQQPQQNLSLNPDTINFEFLRKTKSLMRYSYFHSDAIFRSSWTQFNAKRQTSTILSQSAKPNTQTSLQFPTKSTSQQLISNQTIRLKLILAPFNNQVCHLTVPMSLSLYSLLFGDHYYRGLSYYIDPAPTQQHQPHFPSQTELVQMFISTPSLNPITTEPTAPLSPSMSTYTQNCGKNWIPIVGYVAQLLWSINNDGDDINTSDNHINNYSQPQQSQYQSNSMGIETDRSIQPQQHHDRHNIIKFLTLQGLLFLNNANQTTSNSTNHDLELTLKW